MQAKKYNVSPKTIRDVLNRRTWAKETRHLWAKDEQASLRAPKIKTVARRDPANGEALTTTPFDESENCSRVPRDEISELKLHGSHSTEVFAFARLTPTYPTDLHSTTQSELKREPPVAAWTPALFLPEEAFLQEIIQAGTSNDPFHFDWPNW